MLNAGLAELAEVGFHGLSLEGIARRAGVNKTTLYRANVPIPDTGSLREDLLTLVTAAIRNLTTAEVQAMVRVGITLGPFEPSLAEMARAFWTERLAVDGVIVERAVQRGDIAPVDPGFVIEAVLGPPYFRFLVTGQPVTDDFLAATVDLVVDGLPAAV
ncbi:TetR/AcrR family transcriptional regulator [Crossiella sp. NPDC003009]